MPATVTLIIQVLALLLLAVGLVLYARVVESKTATGRRVLWINLLAMVLVGTSVALNVGVLFQEKTGTSLGLSGGVGSDARAWLTQHEKTPPKKDDPGTNIKLVADAVTFLRARSAQLPPEAQAKVEELSRLPERPKRLLSHAEEQLYFAAASDAFVLIQGLAKGK